MAATLYLLRHAETMPPHGRYLGSTDIALSERGRQGARQIARLLPDAIRQGAILVSPLARCRETAEILFEKHGRFGFDDRLREIDFGAWEGMTFERIAAEYPESIGAWSEVSPGFTFPGGENLGAFCGRIELLADELRAMPGGTATLVTHGGVIRHLICALLGLPHANALLFRADYLSLSRVDVYDQGGVLGLLNRTVGTREGA